MFKVHWIGSTLGEVFGTIGGDNKFKLWREDPSQVSNGGRRFKCIFSQAPSNHIPYASFDFKTIKHEVWLVLVTRDGLLSLLEPAEPESLSLWKELDAVYPFEQHPRGTEPKFKVSFHQSERPCYNAILAGLDVKALSLALSGLNRVKVFRAIKPDEGTYQLYEMVEIVVNATLINDVSWAPGCIRPYDLIATACDDGTARMFSISTPHEGNALSPPEFEAPISPLANIKEPLPNVRKNPSGIGAGLAGASRAAAAARHITTTSNIKHEWMEIAVLLHDDESPVWKIEWMYDGQSSQFLVVGTR
jgi:nucleoporin SEH1